MAKQLIINIIVSISILLVGLFIYHKHYSVKVYSFDIRGFVAQQQQKLMDGQLDKEGMDVNFNKLDEQLNQKGDNVVILTSDVVIRGNKIEME